MLELKLAWPALLEASLQKLLIYFWWFTLSNFVILHWPLLKAISDGIINTTHLSMRIFFCLFKRHDDSKHHYGFWTIFRCSFIGHFSDCMAYVINRPVFVYLSICFHISLTLMLSDSLASCLCVYLTVLTWSRRLAEDLLPAASFSLTLSHGLSLCQDDGPYEGALAESHRDFLPAASLSLSLSFS